ncbi:unnamed protein product [Fusarium graminearum]|uniref:Chromosome 4, complete genome n=3 Tax=Gibberella zeae TaxID=5518 RepID=A0A098DQB0_GIBZE|nr:unnamed protein product [Fusarium graminearum]CZS72358.1 unnamed protein product [Fusarium graminearum]
MSTATEWNVAVGIYGTPLQRYTAFNPSWVRRRRVSLHFAHPMVMNQNDGDKHPPSVVSKL